MASEPLLLVTGQASAAVKGVRCERGFPPPFDVVKSAVGNAVGPGNGLLDTGDVSAIDEWCDGLLNFESARGAVDTTTTAAVVLSKIQSATPFVLDDFGDPVFPVAQSSASLQVTMNIGEHDLNNPPREGFAYIKVRTDARFLNEGSGPPCTAGLEIPCRQAQFIMGSPTAPAVDRRTVPADVEDLPDRVPVRYYIAFPLKRRTSIGALVNVLDLNLHVAAYVFGNGDVAARAVLQAIELPPGWGFLDPFRKPEPSGENGLPDLDPFAVVVAGQAVPAPQGSVLISPPSGTLAPDQVFDLALIVQTASQAISDLTVSFDGLDVSEAVGGCRALHPGALTGGTPGEVIRCPGLSAGLLGPGTHTLSVQVTLSGGATLIDSATWTVLGGSVGPPPAAGPTVEVSPPPGVYTETQAFDLVLVADLQGRTVLVSQITFDEVDVTDTVVACSSLASVPTGQVTLHCPGLSGALLGPGTHIFRLTLILDDGSLLIDGAVWEVLSATGA